MMGEGPLEHVCVHTYIRLRTLCMYVCFSILPLDLDLVLVVHTYLHTPFLYELCGILPRVKRPNYSQDRQMLGSGRAGHIRR